MRKYALILSIFLLAFVTLGQAQTGSYTSVRTSASDPSTCTTSSGAFYWNTGSKRFKGCTATNTFDTIPFIGQANTHTAGAKNTFTPSATTSGFNLVKLSGQPSSPADGDVNNNAGNLELFVTSSWRRLAFTDSNITGNANTATAFQANGTNCTGGQASAGVDAQGNAEGCFTPSVGAASSVTSAGTNPAATGVVKLANNEKICWRNAANSADQCIYLDASNIWNLDGASSTIFTYANATAPGTPTAGSTSIYVDSTNKTLSAKNDAGNVSTTVFGQTVSSNLYVQSILADGTISRKQIAYSEISGTPTLPANTTSTSHQFFTAYNSGTGGYTKAQPATADLSDASILVLNNQNNNFGAFYHDIGEIAAPGNPGASTCRFYVDSTSHLLAAKNSSGTSCFPAGSVTSVGASFTGGLLSVAGTPVSSSGTLAFTVAGTSGGVVYFTSNSTWASSAALTASQPMIGGGAGNSPVSLSVAPATLTDGATITWAIGNAFLANATVTLGGNRTLNITSPLSGGTYVLRILQDATGSRTLALGTGCTWKAISGGSGAITLSTAANAIDILSFYYDGTNCYATLGKNYN